MREFLKSDFPPFYMQISKFFPSLNLFSLSAGVMICCLALRQSRAYESGVIGDYNFKTNAPILPLSRIFGVLKIKK